MKGANESHPKDPSRLSCLKQKRGPAFSLCLPDRSPVIELQGKQTSQALSEGLICGKACLHKAFPSKL